MRVLRIMGCGNNFPFSFPYPKIFVTDSLSIEGNFISIFQYYVVSGRISGDPTVEENPPKYSNGNLCNTQENSTCHAVAQVKLIIVFSHDSSTGFQPQYSLHELKSL